MVGFAFVLLVITLFTSHTSALAFPLTAAKTDLIPFIRSSTCPVKLEQDPPQGSARFTLPFNQTEDLLQRTVTPRIVNGDFIAPGLVPYMVAIFAKRSDEDGGGFGFVCTGTLVSSEWVLSAAHCKITDEFLVILNSRVANNSTTIRRVDTVRQHPRFISVQETGPFDVVAFKLSTPAPPTAKFMKVNINPEIPKDRSFVRILGFGVTSETRGDSGILRQIDVPVVSNKKCQETYRRTDPTAQVCAGYSDGGCDSCKGDSGGAMIQYNANNEPILVGIVSAGRGCAEPDLPGIYIRTSKYKQYFDTESVQFVSADGTEPIFLSSFSTAVIAGIVVGAIVLVIVVGLVVFFVIRRKRRSGASPGDTQTQQQPMGTSSLQPPPTAYNGQGMPPDMAYNPQPVPSYVPMQPTYGSPVQPGEIPVYSGQPPPQFGSPISNANAPPLSPPVYGTGQGSPPVYGNGPGSPPGMMEYQSPGSVGNVTSSPPMYAGYPPSGPQNTQAPAPPPPQPPIIPTRPPPPTPPPPPPPPSHT